MNRQIDFEFSGRTYTAYCAAGAVFDIYEKFGADGGILNGSHCMEPTREGWDACCWILAELARWGELNRRFLGEAPRDMLTVSALQLAPAAEVPRLRTVVLEAINAGFRRDIPDDDEEREVDLVLEKLEAAEKKAPPQGKFARLISRRRPRHSA